MKNIVFLLLCLTSFLAFAQKDPCRNSQQVREIFACETTEFGFEKFDDSSILMAINRDARVACNSSGLCQFSSVTSNDRRFTASFSIGEGNSFSTGMNGGSGGTNIIIPTTGTGLGTSQPYYGITLRYTSGRCTQTVNVPRSVYYAVNRYMYGLMTETGETRRGFTPADEAMIMFYTTIMKQATGCVAAQ